MPSKLWEIFNRVITFNRVPALVFFFLEGVVEEVKILCVFHRIQLPFVRIRTVFPNCLGLQNVYHVCGAAIIRFYTANDTTWVYYIEVDVWEEALKNHLKLMLEEERVVEFLDVGFLLGKINSYTFESFFFFFVAPYRDLLGDFHPRSKHSRSYQWTLFPG